MSEKKAIVGAIMMGGSASIESWMHRNLPEQIEMATTRVPLNEVSSKALLEMIGRLPEAARILNEAHPDVILITSFTGSCLKGQEMVNVIQQTTGVPALVPSMEFLATLERLKAKKVALITGFEPELSMLERLFFLENGIEVLWTLEVEATRDLDPFVFSEVGMRPVLDAFRQADFSDVDAVLVDMPTFMITGQVRDILRASGDAPVLSMPEVMLWSTLHRMGASREHLYLSQFLDKGE